MFDNENTDPTPGDFQDYCIKLAAASMACTQRAVESYGSKQRAVDAIATAGVRLQEAIADEPEEVKVLALSTLLELHVRRLTSGSPTIRPADTPKRVQ